MADLIITPSEHSRGRRRQSTKVDLTAMVDLGFLLITFFMLATTMADPKSMEIVKPIEDGKTFTPTKLSSTLHVLLAPEDKIYYYSGVSDAKSMKEIHLDSTNYSSNGLRSVLKIKQKEKISLESPLDKRGLTVIIKPLPQSSLQNMIDALDEVVIANVESYYLIDPIDKADKLVMKAIGLE